MRSRLLVAYLVVLALSHLVRARDPLGDPLPPAASSLTVAAVDGEARTAQQVRIAWYEWPSGEADLSRPPILLLHGSPGDGDNFRRLAPLLAGQHRVIAPDLPGFGHSTQAAPDYSIRAHAFYVRDLLVHLEVDEVHVVGFSMGGGVGLHLQELAPERVRSLTLLSAIGVQELELLGQYHLNHAVHGLQLAGLWLIFEAVPHFGLLDGISLNLPYARNFYDTDQRPLRSMLERFAPPMLIVHGRHDVLVPFAAAREHHRLVPQSKLEVMDANHFMVFRQPQQLVPPILGFVERVDAGDAPDRAAADPERRRAAAGPPAPLPSLTGIRLVLAMVLIAVATLASEDLTCIATGLLVARGSLDFPSAAIACSAGIFFGDLGLYALGRLGRPLLEGPLRRLIDPRDIARSTQWFEHRGAVVIFLSRFLPGTRLPTYVTAGLLGTRFWWFAANLLVPVVLWTPLLVGLSELVGDRLFRSFALFERYALVGFLGLLTSVWALVALGRTVVTYRGRRRLVGWWHRRTRWEFWPSWAIYPPVVLYILYLALRHKSATLFTAANPGMPAGGGFLGESKAAILERLERRWVARFRLVPAELTVADKVAAVRRFRAEEHLDYPLVLKPDQGQRGLGVAVVRSEEEVELYFRGAPESSALGRPEPRRDVLVQEYVGGAELGVFYVRHPGEEEGRILSITEKVFPAVTGDGRSSLERLILADERAVILAPVYLRRNAERLAEIPTAGRTVELVDVGSHSGGTICRDGRHHETPALKAAVEELCRSFEGFYFGRIDLRACAPWGAGGEKHSAPRGAGEEKDSLEALHQGRDLKVLEINGVTSEATHIYDPAVSVLEAYRVLFEQWRLAFEVGAANRRRGAEPLAVGELLALVVRYRRRGSAAKPGVW